MIITLNLCGLNIPGKRQIKIQNQYKDTNNLKVRGKGWKKIYHGNNIRKWEWLYQYQTKETSEQGILPNIRRDIL